MTLPILAELTALVGGTVLTMAGPADQPLEATVATVLVQDGRIAAIAPDLELPPGTREIDVAGRFVLPGLIDGFVQFDGDHDVLYTAAGVTTVRDMGGDRGRLLLQRTQRDAVPGPKLLTAGTVIAGDPPPTPEAAVFTDANSASHLLPILVAEDVDFLSVYRNLGPEAWARTVELAEAADLEVWGPSGDLLPLAEVIAAGHHGFVYMDSLLPTFAEEQDGVTVQRKVDWEIVQPLAFKKNVAALAAADAAVMPMLRATAMRLDDLMTPEVIVDRYLRWMAAHYAGWWMGERQVREQVREDTPGFLETGRRVVDKQATVLAMLDEAGVRLVPGSGSPHPWLMPGVGLVEELELWVAAGLSTERVLRAVTVDAAANLGLEGRGVLAEGRVADVIVVDADPRADVGNLRRPSTVIVRGSVLGRPELDELESLLLAEMEARHQAEVAPLEVAAPSRPEGEVVMEGFLESRTNGIRVSAERWCVVREPDGTLAFCGRVITPPEADFAGSDLNVIQRVVDGKLSGFQTTLTQGDSKLMLTGLWAGQRFNMERRLDGAFVDSMRSMERPVSVDVGSVTTAMVLGHLDRTGTMPGIKLHEEFEPEVVPWALEIAPQGVHLMRLSTGGMGFDFDETGAIRILKRQVGSAELLVQHIEKSTFGGPGLPVPTKTPTLDDRGAPQGGR